jgi:hypothetical protein
VADSSAAAGESSASFTAAAVCAGQRIAVDFDHREILWLGLVEKT